MNRLSLNINFLSKPLISLLVGVLSAQSLGKSSDKIKLIPDKKEDPSILKRAESLNTYLDQNEPLPPKYPLIKNLPENTAPILDPQFQTAADQ